jgi:hypothetical protein
MTGCVEEAVLQAYVDAELPAEEANEIAHHLHLCGDCAELAQSIVTENSMMAEAFAAELSLAVPTERLRSRIEAAVQEFQLAPPAPVQPHSVSFWNRLLELFSAPSAGLGYAGALAVLVVFVSAGLIFISVRSSGGSHNTAAIDRAGNLPGVMGPTALNAVRLDAPPEVSSPELPGNQTITPVARHPRRLPGIGASNVSARKDNRLATPLPGETGYLKAIASLTGALEASGERSLRPSVRADYERNIAVVDHAIEMTRKTARQNPHDQYAANFLYSSYQSKVDLLNAVADQSLIAAR